MTYVKVFVVFHHKVFLSPKAITLPFYEFDYNACYYNMTGRRLDGSGRSESDSIKILPLSASVNCFSKSDTVFFNSSIFADASLMMSANTEAVFTAWWGEPAAGAVQVESVGIIAAV